MTRAGRLGAGLLAAAGLMAAGCGASVPGGATAQAPAGASAAAASQTQHYEYVFPDQAMYVYDIDHGLRLVRRVSLPSARGIRGAVASPRTHMLYISHGGDSGGNGDGSLLAYDLLANRVVWDRSYGHGIDSMAISPDGSRIYMPDGELAGDGTWYLLDARTGSQVGQISGGLGPHNTSVSLNGRHVYLGGRNSPYLDVASTSSNRLIRRIGPLKSGVRPFTVNGRESLAFTTATGFLGFQVSSISTGRVLYTVTFGRRFGYNPANFSPSAPSHGISLSPNERQVWVIDGPNSYVHVYDITGLPHRPPRHLADIRLSHGLAGSESGCSYDCARDGWLQHSRSGCLVFVGDSGDVLSASRLRPVAFLPALRDSRKEIEIDWRGGVPIASTSRTGLGYVTSGRLPRAPRCR
jgi:DNA-binding beta-propeller fold protein YncE